jgi:hypothetical protein
MDPIHSTGMVPRFRSGETHGFQGKIAIIQDQKRDDAGTGGWQTFYSKMETGMCKCYTNISWRRT